MQNEFRISRLQEIKTPFSVSLLCLFPCIRRRSNGKGDGSDGDVGGDEGDEGRSGWRVSEALDPVD
jgi:hypothetical protein